MNVDEKVTTPIITNSSTANKSIKPLTITVPIDYKSIALYLVFKVIGCFVFLQ